MNETPQARPEFSKRVVVTSGMPYGNKDLHFGHMGGLIVHADAFARFMRDRIGAENVLFLSGTDCYGSPIVEYHRNAVQSGEFTGNLQDFVTYYHELQKDVLNSFQISMNLFSASGLGESAKIHTQMCGQFFTQLFENKNLKKADSQQFFDAKLGVLLNGRQVLGNCPVRGCKSEKAYADECALGHPYEPKELINPKSTLTGDVPELRSIQNWYLDLEKFKPLYDKWTENIESQKGHRPFVVSGIREFLDAPSVFLKQTEEDLKNFEAVCHLLPPYEKQISKNGIVKIAFQNLVQRDAAEVCLNQNNVRFRAGKTLVPFRLSGNVEWGVPTPALDKSENESAIKSTFWVWPESLWAPISFTAAHLQSQGLPREDWKKWWASVDSKAFQFIGEDNLYFYSIAEMGMFFGSQNGNPQFPVPDGQLQAPHLVVNNHILYFDKKASSSGNIKPPMARELLSHYTADQLRAHFLALGLGVKSVGFKPKPFNPAANANEGDPVLKDGNLLCNAFNKALRTSFSNVQKYFENVIPVGEVSQNILDEAAKTILSYEASMARQASYECMALLDTYIRNINKLLTTVGKAPVIENATDNSIPKEFTQSVIDAFHMIRIATVLLHPIAPTGSELTVQMLNLKNDFFCWDNIFKPIYALMKDPAKHEIQKLESRFDFYPKHPSQF